MSRARASQRWASVSGTWQMVSWGDRDRQDVESIGALGLSARTDYHLSRRKHHDRASSRLRPDAASSPAPCRSSCTARPSTPPAAWRTRSRRPASSRGTSACSARCASSGPQSQGWIGERLGIDRTTMVQLVDELERRGLVERKRNPNDRRQLPADADAGRRRDLGLAPRRSPRAARTSVLAALDDERARRAARAAGPRRPRARRNPLPRPEPELGSRRRGGDAMARAAGYRSPRDARSRG